MDNKAITSKILSLSGLCRRAGGVVPGADAVIGAVKRGGRNRPVVIILSRHATERTQKQISDKASYASIPLIRLDADPFEIGDRLGIVSSCAVYALTGKGPSAQVAALGAQLAENNQNTDR